MTYEELQAEVRTLRARNRKLLQIIERQRQLIRKLFGWIGRHWGTEKPTRQVRKDSTNSSIPPSQCRKPHRKR